MGNAYFAGVLEHFFMEKEKIWLSSPHMGGKEFEYVKEAFDTNWIAPVGPHINRFEEAIAKYQGGSHVAVLSSGTAAIHLALIILGVKTGDEVICSTFTFSGSANPIMYQGATPVFVDSEAETWNMCPDALEEAIQARMAKGKRPKAIILVHLYGMSAQMDELMAVARKHQIPVIEDAAEALGAHYRGQKLGSFGDFGIFSFNGNKIITSSGGGALISQNKNWIEKARFLSTQARDQAPHYQHSEVGYNYRMSNVCAAIGLGQLEVLDERVSQRRNIFQQYIEGLADCQGIEFVREQEGSFANRWLTTILVDSKKSGGKSREDIRLALEAENIESRPLWKPMHLQPVFADAPFYGKGISEKLFENGLCLPSGSNMGRENVDRVLEVIKRVLN